MTISITKMDVKEISLALNNKETTLNMANAIIDDRAKEMQESALIKRMFRIWGQHIVGKNVDEIFNNSKSPIERTFLNSVHFFGLLCTMSRFSVGPIG